MARFRSAVFEACKLLDNDDRFSTIRDTMYSLRFCKDTEYDPKRDIACNGLRINEEFYGILLAFEKGFTSIPNPKISENRLSTDEKKTLYFGNSFLTAFVDECLNEITEIAPDVAKAIHPYGFLTPIDQYQCEEKVDIAVLQPAITAFKETSIYKYLMESNVLLYFKPIPKDTVFQLMMVLERDIINNPRGSTIDDILALKVREKGYKPNMHVPTVDALHIISFKLLALKQMLANALKLLFGSIVGEKLIVINEDNLINIEKDTSDVIYTYKTVLLQGCLFTPFSEIIKSIVLLHIKNEKVNLHEFGLVRSVTENFISVDGETTKLTFCIVDEDLNPLYSLTE